MLVTFLVTTIPTFHNEFDGWEVIAPLDGPGKSGCCRDFATASALDPFPANSITYGVPNGQECKRLCKDSPNCVAVEYMKVSGKCELHNSRPEYSVRDSATCRKSFCKARVEAAVCLDGDTGLPTADGSVVAIKDVNKGDKLTGLDKAGNVAECTVSGIWTFPPFFSPTYGNYTKDHYIFDKATGLVREHGAVGEKKDSESLFSLVTQECPFVFDESGTAFSPASSLFCDLGRESMTLEEHSRIHALLSITGQEDNVPIRRSTE